MKTQPQYLLLSCFLLFTALLKGQDTIHVPQDYPTIQSALDAAEANTRILVSPGTYYENLEWPLMEYGIQLIGQKGSDSTIIDGNQSDRVIYKRSFTDDPGSLIEGFTIRNGKTQENGGGMHIDGRGTTLRNLIVVDNQSSQLYGGGVYLQSYSGLVDRCVFSGNHATGVLSASGGGMYVSLDGPVEIRNSTFTLNSAKGLNSGLGGGLYSSNSSHYLLIHNCIFKENNADNNSGMNSICRGGGMYVSGESAIIDSCLIEDNWTKNVTKAEGGGIYSTVRHFTLQHSVLKRNVARAGYAIMLDANEMSTNTILQTRIQGHRYENQVEESIVEARAPSSSLDIRNSMIDNNHGRSIKVDNEVWPPFQLHLGHCTIAYNNLGGLELRNTNAVIQNSILWNWHPLEEFKLTEPYNVVVNYSLVSGGYEGSGNIDSNPMFNNSFSLTPADGSPCLSAGNPWFAEPFDISGNPRPLPSNSLPDLGAIEVRQSLAFIHLKFYFDINENGIRDTTERFAQIGAVKVNNDKTYTNFKKEGFVIPLDTGALTIAYNEDFHAHWKVTSEPSYTNYIDTNAFFDVVEFGIAPIEEEVDADTYITSDPMRCNDQVNMRITVANEYSYIGSSILWLSIDDRVQSYTFQGPPDTIKDPHTIGWFVEELYPTESITFYGNIVAPGITGGTLPGDTIKFTSWIEGLEEESIFAYDAVLRCSYDPNDKLINPGRPDSLALIDAPLFYTIRFQNTGNDYARHVSIIDTLDAYLDLSTFRLIQTSHPDHLEVIFQDDNVVRFNFENIFLPDSTTNFEASNGHVAYSIRALADVERESIIENTAEIYFDANPPVITNTTSSIMVDDFIMTGSAPIHSYTNVAYPSLTTGDVYLLNPADAVHVFDGNGILLEKYKAVQQIDLHHLKPGLYFIKVFQEEQHVTQKIVLIK